MRSFKDSRGRTWDVEINPLVMKRVKARTDFALAKLLDKNMELYGELISDPVKFVEVLFVIVSEQAEARKVSEDDFFACLSGDELEGAYDAFREAFQDFSPGHLRTVLRAADAKSKVATERKTERALRAIEAIDPDAEEKRSTPDQPATSSPSATAAPASSASIPEG